MSDPRAEKRPGEIFFDPDHLRDAGIICYPGIDCHECAKRDDCKTRKDFEQAVRKCSDELARAIDAELLNALKGR